MGDEIFDILVQEIRVSSQSYRIKELINENKMELRKNWEPNAHSFFQAPFYWLGSRNYTYDQQTTLSSDFIVMYSLRTNRPCSLSLKFEDLCAIYGL